MNDFEEKIGDDDLGELTVKPGDIGHDTEDDDVIEDDKFDQAFKEPGEEEEEDENRDPTFDAYFFAEEDPY